jgi:transcriptional regulator with XRE-family HTH domain
MSVEYHANIEFFALRLAKLRMKKGISAQKMSGCIGRSRSYIGQLERKFSLPTMNEFFYICDFLEVLPKDFFDGEVEFPSVFLEMLNNMKKLDEEQLKSINTIVKGILKV